MAAMQKAPLRLTIGPWAHLYPHEGTPGPKVDFPGQALRWWDHWLKGIDNGVADEPALEIFQTDGSAPAKYMPRRPGHWYTEASWPTPNVAPQVLRLGPGRLGDLAEAGELVLGPRQKVVWSEGDWVGFGVEGDLPGDQRVDDGDSLTFTGAPLDKTFDILGNPELLLELQADGPAANISARLIDVAPDGSEYLVTRGLANLAQNSDRSATVPLVAGQRFTAKVQLHGISHRFLPGHRIKLAVSNGYWPIMWPAAGAVSLRVFTEGAALTLPVRTPPAGEVGFDLPAPPPHARTGHGRTTLQPGRLEREVRVDQMTGEITHRSYCEGGVFGPIGRVRLDAIGMEMHHITDRIFRITPDVIDSARYEMMQSYEMVRGDWAIRTEIFDACSCDATHSHIISKVEAFENGKLVHSKSWKESIPRP